MTSNTIQVCGGDYEHVLGLGDAGNTSAPPLHYRVTALGELGRQVLGGGDFDVAEYSLANLIMLHDRGTHALAAIPVFPSRAFRNASVFVPRPSPLTDLRALAGCRVGISEFAMTTAVWTRGHLSDDFGLDCRSIEWLTGPKPRFPAPEGVRTTVADGDLETLLLEGRIDALMTGKPRDLQLPPAQRNLRTLSADAEQIERRYFDATGLFPIMHTVVLHPRLVAREPGLPRRVFEAYAGAKRAARKRRLGSTWLPFAERQWDQFCPPGGGDPYGHGLTELNRRNIATLCRYLLEQGFIDKKPEIDDLFVAGSGDWRDD